MKDRKERKERKEVGGQNKTGTNTVLRNETANIEY